MSMSIALSMSIFDADVDFAIAVIVNIVTALGGIGRDLGIEIIAVKIIVGISLWRFFATGFCCIVGGAIAIAIGIIKPYIGIDSCIVDGSITIIILLIANFNANRISGITIIVAIGSNIVVGRGLHISIAIVIGI